MKEKIFIAAHVFIKQTHFEINEKKVYKMKRKMKEGSATANSSKRRKRNKNENIDEGKNMHRDENRDIETVKKNLLKSSTK